MVAVIISSTMVVVPVDHQHAEFTRTTELAIRQSPIPTLRALLIGIDAYKNFTQLSGAVKDVQAIYDFLHSDLSVPDSRITKLTNERATRVGIISALEGLSKDPSINRFDPILIFYAGHGCEVDSPLANYREKAQCLVPWDMGDQGTDEPPISPIPDYTISALLNELATKKGNNITVILDSCHSASSTRGIRHAPVKPEPGVKMQISYRESCRPVAGHELLESNCRARSLNAQNVPPLSLDTDKDIIRRARRRKQWRAVIISIRYHLLLLRILATPEFNQAATQVAVAQPSLEKTVPELVGFSRSHVLLAACAHAEQSYECATCNSGYFTSALLQVLRSRSLLELKYKQCFEEFPKLNTPSPQNPVCEGASVNRVFFKIPSRITTARTVSFTLQDLGKGYFLKLGDAQGVFPGSKYGIYQDLTIPKELASGYLPSPTQDRPLLGQFTANPCLGLETTLYPFYSWCKFDANARLPDWPRAKLLTLGIRGVYSLRVFASDALKQFLDPNVIVRVKQGMRLVESKEIGTIILDIGHGGSVTFELVGFPGVLYSCSPDAKSVHRILISMAQWTWHRSRVPQVTFDHKIMAKLTLYELGECGPRPLPVEQDGSTTIKVSSTTRYALRITSLFPNRLYAYLFYFSTAHQSIRPLYLGVYGSGYIDPPLEPFGELTVGYNNDDMIPGALSFTLAPDEGYFQLFLVTSPGDFDSVAQPSPFITPHTMPNGNEDEYGDGLRVHRYASLESSERELEPFSAVSPGASRDHSVGIVAAQVLEVSMFERQKANVGRSLDDSIRRLLPEGVRPELFVAHASQWGVVSLKVKCHEPNA